MTNCTASPRTAVVELVGFAELEFCRTHRVHTQKILNSWKSIELLETVPAPQPPPIYKLRMTSMLWVISIGQRGYLSGCAPSRLLHTCLLAEHRN